MAEEVGRIDHGGGNCPLWMQVIINLRKVRGIFLLSPYMGNFKQCHPGNTPASEKPSVAPSFKQPLGLLLSFSNLPVSST